MDFSTLARRELQALCKKNKIPANITNVAMVEALNALEIVEGMEELLKPAESEMEYSSIESPEKNANTQQSVPRTGYRTSTRQKPVREEDDSLQSLTRTCRAGTRRRIAGDVEEAVTGTLAVRSSRKKAPAVQLKQSEEDQKNGDQMDKENKSVPQTPAAAPSTLRRGTRASTRPNMNSDLMEEKVEKTTAVRRVYSTRRSVRLSEKKVVESNPMEKESTQAIKMDSFSEYLGEVSENSVVPGGDLPVMPEEYLEKTDDSQALVDQKSNVSSESVKDLKHESISSSEVSVDAVTSRSTCSNVVDLAVDSQMQEAKTSFAEEAVLSDLVIKEAEKSESKLDSIQDVVNEEQSDVNVTADNAETYPVPKEVQEQSNYNVGADDAETYPVPSEVQEQSNVNVTADDAEPYLVPDEVQEQSNDNVSADDAETYPVPSEVQEQSNGNVSADDAETYPVHNEVKDIELSFAADDNFSGKDSKESDDEPEVDSNSIEFSGENTSNNELDCEKSLTPVDFSFHNEEGNVSDFVGPDNDTTKKPEREPAHEVADEPVEKSIDVSDESDFSTDSELDSKESVTEESEIEAEVDSLHSFVGPTEKTEAETTNDELSAKSGKTPASAKQHSQIKGNVAALIFEDDPVPNPSPLRKSSSKTPLSARRMAAHDLDDKENTGHSGRKLELTKEKKKKGKKEKALKEASLRQLTKMLKEKLRISNNTVSNNEEENVAKVVKTRPALQALPENRLAVGELEMEN